MDEATQKAIEKIAKLMQLAGRNPNEAEAASALGKAQELLTAYNLSMAVVEQASGASGRRVDDLVRGGMHKYQRMLWSHIAKLNFCMYWPQKNRYTAAHAAAGISKRKWLHEHRVVGRQVNVVSTQNMARYLDGTIERLCRERLGGDAHRQYYSREAVAFREGIADRVTEKVLARRRDMEDEEGRKQAEAARQASASGVSLSTSLTIAGLKEREEQANYDFLNGEGAWAKREARMARNAKYWAEETAKRAAAEAAAERELAEWAAAHPEEAAAAEARRRESERREERREERAEERRAARRTGRRYRFRETAADMRRDSGSYAAGYEAGERVSIDQQVGDKDQKRIGK